jgi:hypothetical protein
MYLSVVEVWVYMTWLTILLILYLIELVLLGIAFVLWWEIRELEKKPKYKVIRERIERTKKDIVRG